MDRLPLLPLRVNPRVVRAILFAGTIALVVIDSLLNVARYGLGYSSLFGLVEFFGLDRERNFSTWYATLLLAFAALLLADAAAAERLSGRRHFRRLLVLAVGFCYLSLDENVSLHERLSAPAQLVLGVTLVLLALLCAAGWLVDLPYNIRWQVLMAGGVYLGGALGMDLVGAVIQQLETAPLLYATSATVEEGLELLGVALFIIALLNLKMIEPVRAAPEAS